MTVEEFCAVERWNLVRRLGVAWQVQGFSTDCVTLKCIYQDPPYLVHVMYEQRMWVEWIKHAQQFGITSR